MNSVLPGPLPDEELLFDIGRMERSGVDFPPTPPVADRLGDLKRETPCPLPSLSEPEMIRHYIRLSRMNYAIDIGLFPLGSCTMKHNPRLNEKLARLPGFADIHPLQPDASVQGALRVMADISDWLKALTNMPAVALSPKAGAQGEFCGMLAIRRAIHARGEPERTLVLAPDSAHGTNPATAVRCGFRLGQIAARDDGRLDSGALARQLREAGDVLAAVMLTNPNTCGLLEPDMKAIADMVHDAGGYLYCDGANFNAFMGRIRPGDLGVDAMHINLHKTFSTPHGGGGPGAGPTVLSEALAPFAPFPRLRCEADGRYRLIENDGEASDRLCAFHGQMGMFVRALAYMLSLGSDGCRQASADAVLSANYLLARLKNDIRPAYDGSCMHEILFSDEVFAKSGITTLDIAKGLIDEGFHPMTVYFPLSVSGAMLIEPTETEPLRELDRFADALIALVGRARQGDQRLREAPYNAPRRRLDDVRAARRPVLVWTEQGTL